MHRYSFFVLCILYFVLLVSTRQVNAGWNCQLTQVDPAPAPQVFRCVESATATDFRTLRGCLRCEDDLSITEKPNTVGGVTTICPFNGTGDNECTEDPRYVMRNFAALNFWSIGRGLSLAVPLVIVGGGLLCLVFLLYGAFTYVMSGGEEKKITDAMHMMTYAALGLVVIVIGYAAVRTILFITKINTFGF